MPNFPPIDIEEMVRLAPDLFCSSSAADLAAALATAPAINSTDSASNT